MKTQKDYEDMTAKEKLIYLALVVDEAAARCGDNFLTAGTWIEEAFEGIAERLREIASEM
jgi:hypothetical protein